MFERKGVPTALSEHAYIWAVGLILVVDIHNSSENASH